MMNFKNRIKNRVLFALLASVALVSGNSYAGVSNEDAARLQSDLTPYGAERAGNKAGTIPKWQGSSSVKAIADDKPLFIITAKNADQYSEYLTKGTVALLAKYPDTFELPVYQSRRTFSAPQWVYDNIAKNAVAAQLTDGGNGVANAFGGIPFPMAKNGLEAIWNHNLRFSGQGSLKTYGAAVVYPNGDRTDAGGLAWETFPYYAKDGSVENFAGTFWNILIKYDKPTRRKGEVILVRDPLNQAETPRQAWQYIPGQRRVRRAPTIAFDTPNSQFSGQSTYDDSFMFNGSPERYNWKLVGKQEKYVPYNNDKFQTAVYNDPASVLTPNHVNPKFERWEMHRVWVVEATLKEDSRHVYAKRRFYLDEDSWVILSAENYDARGELWRAGFAHFVNYYDQNISLMRGYWQPDFINGSYAINEMDLKPIDLTQVKPATYFTPQAIRKLSRR